MIYFIKNIWWFLTGKRFVLKLYYRKRSEANAVFNVLSMFFLKRSDACKILKSDIIECSPFCSDNLEWCVMFKILDYGNIVSDLSKLLRTLNERSEVGKCLINANCVA